MSVRAALKNVKSAKRARYALEYSKNGGDHKAAAEAAGFAAPAQEITRLRNDANVQALIEAYQLEMLFAAGESRETVVSRETLWANLDAREYVKPGTDWELKSPEELTEDQARRIKAIRVNAQGHVSLEFVDPAAANRRLAEYLGMLDKDTRDDLSLGDAAALLAAAIDRIDETDNGDEDPGT